MECHKLQLSDYFQFVENDPIKYCEARFIFDRVIKKIETSKMGVPPRQNATGIKKKSTKTTVYAYTKTGKRSAMKITFQDGSKKLTKWKYDQFGRLLEINDDGKLVTYEYSLKTALLAKQIINGIPLYYTYTKYNQLESKSLGSPIVRADSISAPGEAGNLPVGVTAPISYVKYFYAPDGSITAREVSGIKQNYEYDVKNQQIFGRNFWDVRINFWDVRMEISCLELYTKFLGRTYGNLLFRTIYR